MIAKGIRRQRLVRVEGGTVSKDGFRQNETEKGR